MQKLQKLTPEQLAATILGRVEKSSPDALLASLCEEIALLQQANEALEDRIAAAESRPSGLAPLAPQDSGLAPLAPQDQVAKPPKANPVDDVSKDKPVRPDAKPAK